MFGYTDQAELQTYNGEDYNYVQVRHTPPTFSEEAQDQEIDIEFVETVPLAQLFINPVPYKIQCVIYEFDREAGTVTEQYKGWVVRAPFNLNEGTLSLRLKSAWLFFERDSLVDSLSALSRYSILDPRSGGDINDLVQVVTVLTLNDERDVITVSGITQIDTWFRGGVVTAPDQDRRTILEHIGNTLTLNGAFSRFSLDVGFPAELLPGDDLTYDTWANKFADYSNRGQAHGGWPYTPNVDPVKRGVI